MQNRKSDQTREELSKSFKELDISEDGTFVPFLGLIAKALIRYVESLHDDDKSVLGNELKIQNETSDAIRLIDYLVEVDRLRR